jgi:hypothetical protein
MMYRGSYEVLAFGAEVLLLALLLLLLLLRLCVLYNLGACMPCSTAVPILTIASLYAR